MSDNNKINNIYDSVIETLNNEYLQRINPIFKYEPDKHFDNGHFLIQFPQFLDDLTYLKTPQEYRQPELIWFVFGGLILCSQIPEDLESPEKVELMLPKDSPIYVESVIEAVRKHSKRCLILIDDKLPEALFIDIEVDFKLKNERENLLHSLAESFIKEGNTRSLHKEIQKIIDNKKLSFKRAAQEILNLKGLGIQGDFSYCLTCGEGIEKLNARNEPNYFCRKEARMRKDGTMSNPDNCRNTFRNWQTSRLGLNSIEERQEHILKLYTELQRLIRLRALVAFEEFQQDHPKLYRDRRKRRTN